MAFSALLILIHLPLIVVAHVLGQSPVLTPRRARWSDRLARYDAWLYRKIRRFDPWGGL